MNNDLFYKKSSMKNFLIRKVIKDELSYKRNHQRLKCSRRKDINNDKCLHEKSYPL